MLHRHHPFAHNVKTLSFACLRKGGGPMAGDVVETATQPRPAPAVPPGTRFYAIGDVHGRADLLAQLLKAIEADDAARAPAASQLIFLGDLVDRGPTSADAMEIAARIHRRRPDTRLLMGNHEEVFLRVLQGDRAAMGFFLKIGGRETMLSYGLSADDIDTMRDVELIAALSARVPAHHHALLEAMEDIVIAGDYAFVHAGIRPDMPLDRQTTNDLRWIREPFLSHPNDHAKMIVHGHTVTSGVDEQPNRIGIDTGAFKSHRLTAIGLEGSERWFLAT